MQVRVSMYSIENVYTVYISINHVLYYILVKKTRDSKFIGTLWRLPKADNSDNIFVIDLLARYWPVLNNLQYRIKRSDLK